MKIVLVGKAGTRVCDWRSYALLRDNVQHFIERGEPSERFQALHGIENAIDEGTHYVDAARLREEVLRAWCALWKVRLDSAAISLRTRAILTGNADLPSARGTLPARTAGWSLPISGAIDSPIPRAARRFIQAVLALTDAAVDGDSLQVRCVGEGPRFVRSGLRVERSETEPARSLSDDSDVRRAGDVVGAPRRSGWARVLRGKVTSRLAARGALATSDANANLFPGTEKGFTNG